MGIRKGQLTLSISTQLFVDWKRVRWMVSPLLMELQAHASTSGPLLPDTPKLHHHILLKLTVPALTLRRTGRMKCIPTLATIISVLQATQDLGCRWALYILLILCGMERGVVLLMPAVSSTTLHGSAQHCHNLPPTTSK